MVAISTVSGLVKGSLIDMVNDITGDLYNIIHDNSLWPLRTAEPADYPIQPPIDIGEVVTRRHITDFFIDFMKNDALGRIATLHMTLADQRELGTFDPDCITLASLHSTAVDFSKTGIPVSAVPITSLYIVHSSELIEFICSRRLLRALLARRFGRAR